MLFDDIGMEKAGWDSTLAYSQSKTANALFAVALNERLGHRRVEGFSVHSGGIDSGLSRNLPAAAALKDQIENSGMISAKSIEAGASTQCYAATAPEIAGQGGRYLADCTIAPIGETGQ